MQREDYDTAKQLKADIDKLHAAAEQDGFYVAGSSSKSLMRSKDPQALPLPCPIPQTSCSVCLLRGSRRHWDNHSTRFSVVQEIFERVLDAAGGPPPGPDQAGAETDELESDQVSPLAGGEYFFDPETAGPEGIPPPGNSRVLHSRQGNSAVPLPPQVCFTHFPLSAQRLWLGSISILRVISARQESSWCP